MDKVVSDTKIKTKITIKGMPLYPYVFLRDIAISEGENPDDIFVKIIMDYYYKKIVATRHDPMMTLDEFLDTS